MSGPPQGVIRLPGRPCPGPLRPCGVKRFGAFSCVWGRVTRRPEISLCRGVCSERSLFLRGNGEKRLRAAHRRAEGGRRLAGLGSLAPTEGRPPAPGSPAGVALPRAEADACRGGAPARPGPVGRGAGGGARALSVVLQAAARPGAAAARPGRGTETGRDERGGGRRGGAGRAGVRRGRPPPPAGSAPAAARSG